MVQRGCVGLPARVRTPIRSDDFWRWQRFTHRSVTKTTFLLYFATPAGMMALCDATGAVSIIGRWKPFV